MVHKRNDKMFDHYTLGHLLDRMKYWENVKPKNSKLRRHMLRKMMESYSRRVDNEEVVEDGKDQRY